MSEPDKPLTEQQANYLTERPKQLYTVLTSAADSAVTFLFLVNAGGAAATLSFLGTSITVRTMLMPKVALSCFVVGLLLVGVLRAFRVHDYQKAFDSWHRDYNSFLVGELTWKQFVERDDVLSETSVWEYIIGYGSFACIFAGAVAGTYALLAF